MSKELQNNYDALKRLLDSANEAIRGLQKQLQDVVAENIILKANAENADKNVAIQKQIVIDNLRMTQEEKQKLEEEILTLKDIIKSLRGQ